MRVTQFHFTCLFPQVKITPSLAVSEMVLINHHLRPWYNCPGPESELCLLTLEHCNSTLILLSDPIYKLVPHQFS